VFSVYSMYVSLNRKRRGRVKIMGWACGVDGCVPLCVFVVCDGRVERGEQGNSVWGLIRGSTEKPSSSLSILGANRLGVGCDAMR
jgi:hypothetical protein